MPSWLTADGDPLVAQIVRGALSHIGECEEPASSNRGPMVDAWNLDRGAPMGSYWCASFAASVWHAAGSETAGFGFDPSCDRLMAWCQKTGRLGPTPSLGALVFYGVPGDAHHVGIIVRTTPQLLSVEGNASLGGAFSRNGEAVVLRAVDRARVLAYGAVRPKAAA